MATLTRPRPAAAHPEIQLAPEWAEVTSITPEAEGIATYALRFTDPGLRQRYAFQPGQFNMLYVPGYGEAAISMSSAAHERETVGHTIRFVGNVTRAISRLRVGDLVGVRGPFGAAWPMQALEGRDVVIAAGGIGLAPLRPAIYHILANRAKYGGVVVVYGARTAGDLLYTAEFDSWRAAGLQVEVTVDRAGEGWRGQVGVVPMLFYRFRLDHQKSAVLTCGPEIMMRFVVYEALARRIPPERVLLSLERNMKCGQGQCGRCQIGPHFICKDGPVFRFDQLSAFFNVEEF